MNMSDIISFSDEEEDPTGVLDQRAEVANFPQTLVAEKIIFVIDVMLLANDEKSEIDISSILILCRSYFNVKNRICAKPTKFECLLYNDNAVFHSCIESVRDFQTTLLQIKNLEFEDECQPLKIDSVFDKIANLVELPDPKASKKGLPPNWVYHVIWLFGRNLHIPTMEDTNSFDYLMMTPFFALDILYLYNKTSDNNECEAISQALLGLNENAQGYFLSASITEKAKAFSSFAQFLGHPLLRLPQVKAKFNILELSEQINYNDCNKMRE